MPEQSLPPDAKGPPMKPPKTYKEAGVDIDAADRLVDSIRIMARSTFRKEVKTDIGGFGGVVGIDLDRYPEPLLVASTDGVGTKLRIAFETDRHETIGIDLVAMCVNDVIVQGAEPLFFLDYFATGKLDPERAGKVLQGIAEGCRIANCSLIGGETAEMPSFYPEGEYELAGFCVGVVNRDRLIDGRSVRPGDALLGIASSGLHSNGYSLVRRVFSKELGYSLHGRVDGLSATLGEELLRPTRIYVKPVLELLSRLPVKGLAHITGGGLVENIPRILPTGCRVRLDLDSWPVPEIFRVIEKTARVELPEMLRTFNCGIGMVVVTEAEDADRAAQCLKSMGESVFRIGGVLPDEGEKDRVSWA
jgi:phosphoribosylformylglycinamidine cyclo-ligase